MCEQAHLVPPLIAGIPAAADRSRGRRALLLMAILTVPLAARFGRWVGIPRAAPGLENAKPLLDPNSAAWWELALLPEVGAGLAQAITTYRAAAASQLPSSAIPVFAAPVDLEAVPGIGPATRQAVSPYLAFPQGSG